MSDLPATTSTGLPSNVAGALSYLLGPLTGIAFLVLEKQDRFVRFHAAQSLVISVVGIVVSIAISILSAIIAIVPLIGWLIGLVVGLGFSFAAFALWILLMFRAFQGREWELPVASEYARKLIAGPAA